MRKQVSSILALCLTASAFSAFPAAAALRPLVQADFENGTDGFTARGNVRLSVTSEAACSGSSSVSVTGRTGAWNGIAYALSTPDFQAGKTYSIRVNVMHRSSDESNVKFKLTVQYSSGFGSETYDTFETADVPRDKWVELSKDYTLKEGGNPILYIETETSVCDFYLDDVLITDSDGGLPVPVELAGDVNADSRVSQEDAFVLRDYLAADMTSGSFSFENADLNRDGRITAADLTLLKQRLLHPEAYTTTSATVTTTTSSTTTTATTVAPGNHMTPKEYIAKVNSAMTQNVPDSVRQGDKGTTSRIRYFSKKAGHEKNANVWLPPGYSPANQYPVLYMNHGIFGNEDSMLTGFAIREMASNLITSGEAVPFIIVFPQMYTDPASEAPAGGITQSTTDHYDDYLYDLTESLMPYIEEHYSVRTGRDNTAIAGFSMGGRETLYITISRPDLFGYSASSSPAPGIVPATDMYLNHAGSYIPGTQNRMKESDFRIADDKMPYLLMIGGGTNDGVVGTFPKQYHELFTRNGVDHIWMEVAGGGHDGSVGTPLFYNYFRALFKA